MRTIAIINLKGGVAKTTSSINIAYILSTKGYKVLALDNDEQGDLSRGFERRTEEKNKGTDQIMNLGGNADVPALIKKTAYEGLDIIPANYYLCTANQKVAMDFVHQQQNRIAKALEQVRESYDFCVIDNAPSVNIGMINALTAADDVLIPIEIDDNTYEGMENLLNQIKTVKEGHNPDMKNIRGFVTRYSKANDAHYQGEKIFKQKYPMMNTKIRFSLAVAKSTFNKTPVVRSCPWSAAAKDYLELVEEYLEMIGDVNDGKMEFV